MRIALREDEILEHPLRHGLSTVTAIDVRNTEQSPNAALTEVSSPEDRTSIFSDDVAEGNAKAEQVIKDNLTPQDLVETECRPGE